MTHITGIVQEIARIESSTSKMIFLTTLLFLRNRKVADGKDKQDSYQDDRQCRRSADIKILEALLPQVEEQHIAGIAGPAAGKHKYMINSLEGADKCDGRDK